MEIRDALGRVAERRWYTGNSFETRTEFTYDELGRLTESIQGPTLNTLTTATRIKHTYDTLGRKTKTEDPDAGTWIYTYDALGNLKVEDDPKTDHHIQHCYDVLNRVTKRCAMSGSYTTNFDCNAGTCPGEQIVYSYDGNYPNGWGRLTSVADGSGSTSLAYDVRGRITAETKVIDPPDDTPKTAQMSYQYDAADHLTHMAYPDGEVVQYGYNAVGQLKSLYSQTHQISYLSNLTYDAFGRPRTIGHGNTTTDTRSYYAETPSRKVRRPARLRS